METSNSTYLGDGLYAEDRDGHIILKTLRGLSQETHWVALDSDVLAAFFQFVEQSRNLKITVKRRSNEETKNR